MTKTALITGSAKGIGRAIAMALAEQGFNIAIHYNTSKKEAEEAVRLIKKTGTNALSVQGDVTKFDVSEKIIGQVKKQFGTIDILINNVGVFHMKPVMEHSFLEWSDIIGTNYNAVAYMCKFVCVGMMERRYGRIINMGVAGCDGIRGYKMTGPYTSAKTATLVLTKTLAKELAPYNITVNMISPGIVENSPGVDPEAIPAGRVACYEDIINAVDFLISDKSDYVTGTNINISGGWNL